MKNSIKFIVIICTTWILIFGFFQLESGMLNINKSETNCPFSAHSEAMCQMNPMEHFQEWQNAFTVLPTKNIVSMFLFILTFILIGRFAFSNRFLVQKSSFLFLINIINSFRIFNPLKDAFSNGILNPKIF